jgi:hypothetical protein
MFRAKLVWRLMEMLGELANSTDISPCGTLRVIPTLEFLQHHLS